MSTLRNSMNDAHLTTLTIDTSVGGRFIESTNNDINCEEDLSDCDEEEDLSDRISSRAAILAAELVDSAARMDELSIESSNPYYAEIVANAHKVLAKSIRSAKKSRSPSSIAVSMDELTIDNSPNPYHPGIVSNARRVLATSISSVKDLSTPSSFETALTSPTMFSDDDLSIGTAELLSKAKNRLGETNNIDFENDDLKYTSKSLSTRWQSQRLIGIAEEDHQIVSDSQRQLRRSLSSVSTDQRAVGSKINDVKDKLKKLEERRKERAELNDLREKIKKIEQRRNERALSFQGCSVGNKEPEFDWEKL